MSNHIKLFLLLLCLICFCACDSNKENAVNQKDKLILSLDSGFITKRDALPFFVAQKIIDTSKADFSHTNEKDTICKYYKVKETGNYFLCTIDEDNYSFRTHLLLEITPKGDLIKKERFKHGNFPSCWRNNYEGFRKYGEYFSIKTCARGTGYGASYLYLFKEILPQNKQNSIPKEYFYSNFNGTEIFTSKLEFKQEKLIMHHKLEIRKDEDTLEGFEINKTREFDVNYSFENQKWITKDTAKFKDVDIFPYFVE